METAKYELPAGVKLVCSAAFWPEGRWYFVQDLPVPLVWGRTTGWKKYYEADRADSYFWTREEAMKAWQEAGHQNKRNLVYSIPLALPAGLRGT